MSRLIYALTASLCGTLCVAEESNTLKNHPSSSGRKLLKEPSYESAPKYCLLALDRSGEVTVWMVEDGRRLYVDQNGNGDLTDDGPPLEPMEHRNLDSTRWDFHYALEDISPVGGSRHTQFKLRCWSYDKNEEAYGLSLSVEGRRPVHAGWFGTFWSASSKDAPILQLDGPFTPKLLRMQKFTISPGKERLSLGFINPGSGPGADSRLSIDALPLASVPILHIEWPTEGAPLRTSHPLPQRCCYWDYYTTEFEVPDGVIPGEATVSVELPAGASQIELTTKEIQVPVRASVKEGLAR